MIFVKIKKMFWLGFCGVLIFFQILTSPEKLMANQNVDTNLKEKLTHFIEPDVLGYAKLEMNNHSMDRIVLKPKEYVDVINAGKPVVPFLINLLDDKNKWIRASAFFALHDITQMSFGFRETVIFDSKEEIQKRNEMIKSWNTWWEKNKNKSRTQWLIDNLNSLNYFDFSRMELIKQLGQTEDKSAILPLKKELKNQKYQGAAAIALANLGDFNSAPFIINIFLDSGNAGFREEGIQSLKKLTGQTFNFDPNGSLESRENSIKEWKKWWEENKEKYTRNSKQ